MSNMVVLHVLNSYGGGAVISALELIEALKKVGIQSCIVADAQANESQRHYISSCVEGRALFIPVYWTNKRIRAAWWKRPFIEMISCWKTWKGYRYQPSITRFIRQHNVTLIHTNTIVVPEGGIAAKRNRLPHVWHVRELIGKNKHFQFYNYPEWAKWVEAHCNVLVANSTLTAQCLSEFFNASKIKTIPNGIEVQKFQIKTHVDKPITIVGMVGSATSRWKNHKFFIETAELLKGSPVEFRIYGVIPLESDTYYTELRNMINERGVQESVKFIQAQTPPAIMQEIDILFHPTDLESFGRIFIEAMAGGIPVVAVNQGGALEVVKDSMNGYLIPLNDKQAAVTAIQVLAADFNLRNRLGQNGRALSEQEYSLNILAARIRDLYLAYTT